MKEFIAGDPVSSSINNPCQQHQSTSTLPVGCIIVQPESPDRFAAEVYRGMQQIASGLGMIIAAWGRKYALKGK